MWRRGRRGCGGAAGLTFGAVAGIRDVVDFCTRNTEPQQLAQRRKAEAARRAAEERAEAERRREAEVLERLRKRKRAKYRNVFRRRRVAPPGRDAKTGVEHARYIDRPFVELAALPDRFKVNLPKLPMDAKLLDYPYDLARLWKREFSDIERNAPAPLLFDADLGVPVDTADLTPFGLVGEGALDPADEAICQPIDDVEGRSAAASAKDLDVVSWLTKPVLYDPTLSDSVVRRSAKMKKIMAGRSESLRERRAYALPDEGSEEALDRVREQNLEWADKIDAQFKAANVPLGELRHPDKPELRAVSAAPLIVDAERAGDEHVWVHFDSDPAEDLPLLASAKTAAREHARVDQGVLYVPAGESLRKSRKVQFAVPDRPVAAGEPETGEAAPYRWARQYVRAGHELVFDRGDGERRYTYFVEDRGDGIAWLVPVARRMNLNKTSLVTDELDAALAVSGRAKAFKPPVGPFMVVPDVLTDEEERARAKRVEAIASSHHIRR